MAFGRSNQQELIKEGGIEIGQTATPEATTDSDPLSSSGWVSAGDVGYFQQGTLNPEMNRSYAEFLAGTPAVKVRKDLIRKDWNFSCQMGQYNADTIELCMGLDVSVGTYTLGFIGSDEVPQPQYAYLITTFRVDGAPIYMMMFWGKQTGEAVGPKLPGTAHSTYDFKAESFQHPAFDTAPDETHNYGFFAIGPTPSS